MEYTFQFQGPILNTHATEDVSPLLLLSLDYSLQRSIHDFLSNSGMETHYTSTFSLFFVSNQSKLLQLLVLFKYLTYYAFSTFIIRYLLLILAPNSTIFFLYYVHRDCTAMSLTILTYWCEQNVRSHLSIQNDISIQKLSSIQ